MSAHETENEQLAPGTEPSGGTPPLFVVGVGASAGGLEALERLFRQVPVDSGMAFVVVQHLSPDFDSMMDELLVRQTAIPIYTVTDGVQVKANAIYLIPARKEMIISGGRLLLTDKDPKQGFTLPIDVFFRSLAQDVGSRAIGVVLSGTGSDGSRGIRDIHEAGGLVIAQSEETASFDGMPKSALETGVVDLTLAPEAIAEVLGAYAKHPIAADLAAFTRAPPVDENGLNKLLRLLRDTHGIDFSQYKPSTVVRRIERRLLLNRAEDFDHYVEQVVADPQELNALYRDLLIGVTQFFRDREAFAVLEERVIPELLKKRDRDEELRVWIAGCATGEEAYSIAILLHEANQRLTHPLAIKIFATDVHRSSLDIASAGVYPASGLTEVLPTRVSRYFTPKGDDLQVVAELRQMIVFAPHNIVKDAPFTRLDLVSCRNLLIYLQPNVQKKAVSLFHFGLKMGGVLFLGPSEGVGDLEDEFTPIDRPWRIYRKRRDVRLPADLRSATGVPPQWRGPRIPPPFGMSTQFDGNMLTAYDQLLARFMPPAVLVNDHREVLHVFGGASQYLHFRPGRPTYDVLEYLESDLRTAVAAALQRAMKELAPVSYSGINISRNGTVQPIQLSAIPLTNRQNELTHLLISFEDLQPPTSRTLLPPPSDLGAVSNERIEALELELRYSKERLQATIEELETANEELHAANEELVASNEELQSTNEELHSVNEELYTVNAEYQRKINELSELTGDMENLLAGIDVGVLFLDVDFTIRKFTPRVARSFNILSQDVGRSFDNFTHNIEYPNLMEKLRAVLNTGRPLESEVCDRLGHWHFLRILPYHVGSQIDGVILTLIDIDSLHKAQTDLREKDRELQGILDNAPAFLFIKDLEGRYTTVNRQSRKTLPGDNLLGKTDYDILPRTIADRLQAQDRTVISTGEASELEQSIRRGGRTRTYLSVKYPLRDETGRIFAIGGIWTEITRRKRAEQKARQAIEQRDRFLAMLSHELRNPLAAMQNATQLLERLKQQMPHDQDAGRDSGVIDGTISKACNVLSRQVLQMTRLLDDLLDISRIARGKLKLHREIIDLRRTVEDALLAIRVRALEKRLQLLTDIPDEALFVAGDYGRLQQVQVNLLVNAIKFTPPNGRIYFSVFAEGEKAVIRIRDTGVGMSAELQSQIFEPFVQGQETLDRSDGGMGVGLPLVRYIVELHGGTVEAHSDGPGKGSEFTVVLPLSPPPPEVHSITDRLSPEVAGAAPKLRLMVVEDNADARDMMRMLLESYGYRVGTASDGLSALTAIELEQPDVAFIDIGLPEMDGYALVRQLRKGEKARHTYLVALTGYGQPADRRQAREAGFDAHLTKPVQFHDVDAILSRVSQDVIRRSNG